MVLFNCQFSPCGTFGNVFTVAHSKVEVKGLRFGVIVYSAVSMLDALGMHWTV